MQILIKNGRVVDPANNINAVMDILIEHSRIAKVSKGIATKASQIIDATNKIVMPGLVDMHVHLREPGREDKETVASATSAAAKGGVTSVLAMPNTTPAMDSPERIRLLGGIIKNTAKINVLVCGAISKDRLGKELTDISRLKKEGAVAISDDGASIDDSVLMLEAFKKAKKAAMLVICHSEDKSLSANGVVNLGRMSTVLGLRGISRESEYKRVERDIKLAQRAGSAVHIAHVSCQESVDLIARAKAKKIKVSAETAPHYFSLDDQAVAGYDTSMKMNPPLRRKEDVKAVRQALKSGIIDAVASDHAPHTENEKDIEFERAEFGVIGLETTLAVTITELIAAGLLDWPGLVQRLSLRPAQILGIDKGTLGPGKDADIIIISPDKEWVVKKEDFLSKSKNSPFIDRTLRGQVEYTIYGGEIIYQE